jgi:L-lysine exporter family protein LysE/ArgO
VSDALQAWLLGVVLGAATGIPLGVVNVALVEAAVRVGRRRAIGIGIGGATADTIHAALAFAGLAPLVAHRADLLRWMTVLSAVAIVAYAIRVWRAGPVAPTADDEPTPPGTLRKGIALGLALTLPNPAPLLAWIAVAGAVLPRASVTTGLAGAAGVGLGSALWFAALAHLASRGALRGPIARWLPRAVAIVLVALAALAASRALVD